MYARATTDLLFPEAEYRRLPAALLPPGFQYWPDFLSPDEEAALIAQVAPLHLREFVYQGYTALRRTASFGSGVSLSTGRPRAGAAIPGWLEPLIERVAAQLGLQPEDLGQVLLTEYPRGAPIGWHRDAPPFRTICGISLGSDCDFRLRPHEPRRQTRHATLHLPVERRSLYVISGESRSQWQHSIAPVKAQRYSITLRSLRNPRQLCGD